MKAHRDVVAALATRILRTRGVVRAPIYVYRARLGFLLGNRLLLLEHRGRHSGLRRYVVLEVVDRPSSDTYVIVSGFGERAQWYRNLIANPQVRVSVGRHRLAPAVATLLSPDAADATLARYADRHPRTWEQLRRTLEDTSKTTDLHLPMFSLRVTP